MRLWANQEENKELLREIQDSVNKGQSIHEGCKSFCAKHSKYSISQARARYYQLLNNNPIEQNIIINSWTQEEEEKLLTYCEENFSKGEPKANVFSGASKILNRTYNSVSGKYYALIAKRKKKDIKQAPIQSANDIKELLDKLGDINVPDLKYAISVLSNLQKNYAAEILETNYTELQSRYDELVRENNRLLSIIRGNTELIKLLENA